MNNIQYTKSVLQRKLNEGTLAQEDIEKAHECAVSIGTAESRVLYAQIKRALETDAGLNNR